MPTKKDLKRLVRARMAKTGESYTTARAHITSRTLELPPDHAELAGMPDDSVRTHTGRSWSEWVAALDEVGATEMEHPEIASWIAEHHDEVGSWWRQTVTVGYERIRGLRAVGQGRDGYYTANKSRTMPLPHDRVRRAVHDAETRHAWLPSEEAEPSGRGKAKDFRFSCPDGSRGVVSVTPKGEDKCTVTVQHMRLDSEEERDRRRDFWATKLEGLERMLTT